MHLIFDIGGTKMRLALSRDGQIFEEPTIVSTPPDDSLASEFKKISDQLTGGAGPQTICGGVSLKKLKALEEIKKLFSCPILIENDAALAGLGEARSGAGKGFKIMVYITISTGVGGARIVEGKIDTHLANFEPGHQIIDYREPTKRFEDYVSGAAIRALTGKEPREIESDAFWRDSAKILAVGLCNSILHWTPEVLVLGGSMMHHPGLKVEDIETELQILLSRTPLNRLSFCPKLYAAALGDKGGLFGALALLKQNLSQSYPH